MFLFSPWWSIARSCDQIFIVSFGSFIFGDFPLTILINYALKDY